MHRLRVTPSTLRACAKTVGGFGNGLLLSNHDLLNHPAHPAILPFELRARPATVT
jgi:hypothetical protein